MDTDQTNQTPVDGEETGKKPCGCEGECTCDKPCECEKSAETEEGDKKVSAETEATEVKLTEEATE